MASTLAPNIAAYIAGGTISKGMAVKKGADDQKVVVGAANTDKCFGIAQNDVTVGQVVEVAMPGGGAKGKAGESSITAGMALVSHTDGTLVKANASGDRIVAWALKDAASADVFDVYVGLGLATGADV